MENVRKPIYIRLLGPMSVLLRNGPATPSAAKQRQIFALLSLNSGRVVTVSSLIEELWGDYPPRTAVATLQNYILQLRNRIASGTPGSPCAKQILSTSHGGYLLAEDSCLTDVDEFGHLAARGREAAEQGEYRLASEQLGSALELWRGPALADMPVGRLLELEAASLEENRLAVIERRIEADLALSRHRDLIGELVALYGRNPMNENFCALLMTSLYRSGHVARALETFQRLRVVLREGLGVDPCPRLQRLHQAMLAGDLELEPTRFGGRAGLGNGGRPLPAWLSIV